LAAWALLGPLAAGAAPRVLQVGTWQGVSGPYVSVQAAVDAAQPGDWILIGPGAYHEHATANDGVRITTPGIHLRGMDRNGVIIDGTAASAYAQPCSSDPAAQLFADGGRNGIEVWQTDGVTIENLTVCNFHGGDDEGGNQVWWNGGDGSGQIGMGSFRGAWLTASSTYFDAATGRGGEYGIFVSNSRGPGSIEHSYASNMLDSAFYVGACPDCHTLLRHVHAQNSALGYSGSNSGGHLLIQDSEWDHNRAGIVPNSLAGDDPPSPQDGACPDDPTQRCTIIERNYVHDNNNPNTPAAGLTATAPIGTGIQLSGGQNDWVRDNRVEHNGAWGILVNDYPDPTQPVNPGDCSGGEPNFVTPPPYDKIFGAVIPCLFRGTGNLVEHNHLQDNGFFGNPTNGDLANAVLPDPAGNNCWQRNMDAAQSLHQPTSAPGRLQDPDVAGTCGTPWNPPVWQLAPLFLQAICAAYGPSSGACLSGPGYPQPTGVVLMPIPQEAGMPDPCKGVPANSWCPANGVRLRTASRSSR
jgi:hypothetical protein